MAAVLFFYVIFEGVPFVGVFNIILRTVFACYVIMPDYILLWIQIAEFDKPFCKLHEGGVGGVVEFTGFVGVAHLDGNGVIISPVAGSRFLI